MFMPIRDLLKEGRLQTCCAMTGTPITFLNEYDNVLCDKCAQKNKEDLAGGFFLYETDESQGMNCDYCNEIIYGQYDEIEGE